MKDLRKHLNSLSYSSLTGSRYLGEEGKKLYSAIGELKRQLNTYGMHPKALPNELAYNVDNPKTLRICGTDYDIKSVIKVLESVPDEKLDTIIQRGYNSYRYGDFAREQVKELIENNFTFDYRLDEKAYNDVNSLIGTVSKLEKDIKCTGSEEVALKKFKEYEKVVDKLEKMYPLSDGRLNGKISNIINDPYNKSDLDKRIEHIISEEQNREAKREARKEEKRLERIEYKKPFTLEECIKKLDGIWEYSDTGYKEDQNCRAQNLVNRWVNNFINSSEPPEFLLKDFNAEHNEWRHIYKHNKDLIMDYSDEWYPVKISEEEFGAEIVDKMEKALAPCMKYLQAKYEIESIDAILKTSNYLDENSRNALLECRAKAVDVAEYNVNMLSERSEETMVKRFNFNPDIDMTKIVSSLQIDSGTEICSLEKDNYEVSIRTAGEVKVFVGENDYYTNPSDFPDALKDLIKEHPNDFDSYTVEKGPVQGDVYVSENNWFEMFIYKDGECLSSYVVDIEGQTKGELTDLMDSSMTDWVNTYEEIQRGKAEKEVRESLTPDQKRKIYDEVKIELLTEDVINRLEDEDLFISEEDANYIATKIVEEGKWDSNLSHWDNIDNAVGKYKSDIELSSLEEHIKDEVLNEMISEDKTDSFRDRIENNLDNKDFSPVPDDIENVEDIEPEVPKGDEL